MTPHTTEKIDKKNKIHPHASSDVLSLGGRSSAVSAKLLPGACTPLRDRSRRLIYLLFAQKAMFLSQHPRPKEIPNTTQGSYQTSKKGLEPEAMGLRRPREDHDYVSTSAMFRLILIQDDELPLLYSKSKTYIATTRGRSKKTCGGVVPDRTHEIRCRHRQAVTCVLVCSDLPLGPRCRWSKTCVATVQKPSAPYPRTTSSTAILVVMGPNV